jgi:hypothetical protein
MQACDEPITVIGLKATWTDTPIPFVTGRAVPFRMLHSGSGGDSHGDDDVYERGAIIGRGLRASLAYLGTDPEQVPRPHKRMEATRGACEELHPAVCARISMFTQTRVAKINNLFHPKCIIKKYARLAGVCKS